MPARKAKCIEARSLVSGRNLEPYVSLFLMFEDGSEEQVTQWTPGEAYHHAMAVLSCAEAANTDAFLVSFLVEKCSLNLADASAVLPDFRAWRERRRAPERKV